MEQSFADRVTVVLPSLNPDEKLQKTVDALLSVGFTDIVIVNDGSREDCLKFFPPAGEHITVLTHEVNRGKGAALKTAFRFCAEEGKRPPAVITADGDGQHQIDDISKLFYTIRTAPPAILLGVRDFEGDIPFRSRLGNRTASLLMKTLYRFPFEDTQTGLRAFPGALLEWLIKIPGERYEYETNVLIAAAREEIPVEAVTVHTRYNLNCGISHYRPVRDSLRVTAAMMLPFRRKE